MEKHQYINSRIGLQKLTPNEFPVRVKEEFARDLLLHNVKVCNRPLVISPLGLSVYLVDLYNGYGDIIVDTYYIKS